MCQRTYQWQEISAGTSACTDPTIAKNAESAIALKLKVFIMNVIFRMLPKSSESMRARCQDDFSIVACT